MELFREVKNHTYTIQLLAKQMQSSFLQPSDMLRILREGKLSVDAPEVFASRGNQQNAFMHICTLFNVSYLTEEEKQIMRCLSLIGTQGVPAVRFKELAALSSYDIVNGLIKRSWISPCGRGSFTASSVDPRSCTEHPYAYPQQLPALSEPHG